MRITERLIILATLSLHSYSLFIEPVSIGIGSFLLVLVAVGGSYVYEGIRIPFYL